jgi:hypothetical protein
VRVCRSHGEQSFDCLTVLTLNRNNSILIDIDLQSTVEMFCNILYKYKVEEFFNGKTLVLGKRRTYLNMKRVSNASVIIYC